MLTINLYIITPIIKTIFLIFSFLAIIFCTILVWVNSRFTPLNLQQPLDLTVTTTGQLLQGTTKVGQFAPSSNEVDSVSLLIGNTTDQLQNIAVTITLPTKTTAIQNTIRSIQGTNGMSVTQVSPTMLTANFDAILPESHTSVSLSVPKSYLQLSPFVVGPSIFLGLSTPIWLLVSVALVLIVLLFCLFKTQRPHLNPKELQDAPPEKMSVIDLAVLVKSSIEPEDFSALLFDLANRGHLQIISKNDTIYVLRQSSSSYIRSYEVLILDFLFPAGATQKPLHVVLNTLSKYLFSELVATVYQDIYTTLVEKGYFTENPRLIHLHYKTVGVVTQFMALIGASIAYFTTGTNHPGLVFFWLSLYLSGHLLYVYGYKILPLSPTGIYIWQKITNFSAYLTSSKPIGKEGMQGYIFYEYLPYALVLRKVSPWLNRFADIHFYVPSWFISSDDLIASPMQFYSYVQSITQTISAFLVTLKDPNVD